MSFLHPPFLFVATRLVTFALFAQSVIRVSQLGFRPDDIKTAVVLADSIPVTDQFSVVTHVYPRSFLPIDSPITLRLQLL